MSIYNYDNAVTLAKVRAAIAAIDVDWENYKQYIPASNMQEYNSHTREMTQEEQDEASKLLQTDSKFLLEYGKYIRRHFMNNVSKMDYDSDYEQIENNGSCSLTFLDTELYSIYLGKHLLFHKDWLKPGRKENIAYTYIVHEGWITEETFSDDLVNLKVSGMTKFLEKKYAFEFRQMPRSFILSEVIATAGLNAQINTDGLEDDIINYSNSGSDSDSEDSDSEDTDTTTSSDDDSLPQGVSGYYGVRSNSDINPKIVALAQKICKGLTTDYDKAQAIAKWIAYNIKYPYPNYSGRVKACIEVVRSGYANCYDHASLGYELATSVNVKARIGSTVNHAFAEYLVEIDGKKQWVVSDPGSNGYNWKLGKLSGSTEPYGQLPYIPIYQ